MLSALSAFAANKKKHFLFALFLGLFLTISQHAAMAQTPPTCWISGLPLPPGCVNAGSGLVGGPGTSLGGGASSNTLGKVIDKFATDIDPAKNMFATLSYVIGLIVVGRGLLKVRNHVDSPQSQPFLGIAGHWLAGAFFLALPFLMNTLVGTLHGTNTSKGSHSLIDATAPTGSGADAMFIRLMNDIHGPMIKAINTFCLLAGIILVMVGLHRLVKMSADGPRAASGYSIMMIFVVASVMLSAPIMFEDVTQSLFGGSPGRYGNLAYNLGSATINSQAQAVITSIFTFAQFLGYIAFVRGWMILKSVSEGVQSKTMSAAVVHIIGGVIASNLAPMLVVMQNTLGIQTLITLS